MTMVLQNTCPGCDMVLPSNKQWCGKHPNKCDNPPLWSDYEDYLLNRDENDQVTDESDTESVMQVPTTTTTTTQKRKHDSIFSDSDDDDVIYSAPKQKHCYSFTESEDEDGF